MCESTRKLIQKKQALKQALIDAKREYQEQVQNACKIYEISPLDLPTLEEIDEINRIFGV